jgi:hypothetical protein
MKLFSLAAAAAIAAADQYTVERTTLQATYDLDSATLETATDAIPTTDTMYVTQTVALSDATYDYKLLHKTVFKEDDGEEYIRVKHILTFTDITLASGTGIGAS